MACSVFYDNLDSLFALAGTIYPDGQRAIDLVSEGYDIWAQRPNEERTLLNARRDVAEISVRYALADHRENDRIPIEKVNAQSEMRALMTLSWLERVSFLLRGVCEFGAREIASMLSLPIEEVRHTTQAAMRKLPLAQQSLVPVAC